MCPLLLSRCTAVSWIASLERRRRLAVSVPWQGSRRLAQIFSRAGLYRSPPLNAGSDINPSLIVVMY